jgi:hypothetical protein
MMTLPYAAPQSLSWYSFNCVAKVCAIIWPADSLQVCPLFLPARVISSCHSWWSPIFKDIITSAISSPTKLTSLIRLTRQAYCPLFFPSPASLSTLYNVLHNVGNHAHVHTSYEANMYLQMPCGRLPTRGNL